MCANRIYVQSGIHDPFVERLSKAVSEMKVGYAWILIRYLAH